MISFKLDTKSLSNEVQGQRKICTERNIQIQEIELNEDTIPSSSFVFCLPIIKKMQSTSIVGPANIYITTKNYVIIK